MRFLFLIAIVLAGCGRQTVADKPLPKGIKFTGFAYCMCKDAPYTQTQTELQYCSTIGYGYKCGEE